MVWQLFRVADSRERFVFTRVKTKRSRECATRKSCQTIVFQRPLVNVPRPKTSRNSCSFRKTQGLPLGFRRPADFHEFQSISRNPLSAFVLRSRRRSWTQMCEFLHRWNQIAPELAGAVSDPRLRELRGVQPAGDRMPPRRPRALAGATP